MAAEYAADHLDEIAPLDRDAAVDLIKNASNRAKNFAAAKGTEIHNLAQRVTAGEPVEVPDAIAGYVDAYLAFLSDWSYQAIATEGSCASRRWQYAGAFDTMGTLAGQMAIIDIKTGGSGIWPETCLQVAAYRHAEITLDEGGREIPMPTVDAGYGLWLTDTGYELLPLECGPDIFAVFLHAGHVTAFSDRKKDDLIGLPLATPEAVA
jgi:hypothetical protein